MVVETNNIFSQKVSSDGCPSEESQEQVSCHTAPDYFTEQPKKLFDDWQTLDFLEDSAELIALFDPLIRDSHVTLHPWQIETNENLCSKEQRGTSKHPHKFCLCAANGSGKDAFVIAPWSLWFIFTKIRARVIITSASGVQLTNQTEAYIKSLGDKINRWAIEHYGQAILKINKRHIVCNLSGSEILLFATDQGEMAEGYHPLEPNSEMAIIVNEAKSVKKEIFDALRRCTGYNYWINVSTPGEPIGQFFESWERWPNRKRVTYFDCPHQSEEEFEEDRRTMGEHDPLFRSKWLALFTFVGGKYVIGQAALERLKVKVKFNQIDELLLENKIRVGLDIALSGNGDETCSSAWRGNKQFKQFVCRISDAVQLADTIEKHWVNDLGLAKSHGHIFADDGGVGRAVIDILRRRGWLINRILNQSAPRNKRYYRNRGAELWDKFNKLVLKGCIIPINDEKLFSQLASRKFKESTAGIDKLCLQSKKEMISEGLPSPDRADAAVLAFTDLKLDELFKSVDTHEASKEPKAKVSQEEQERLLEEALWKMESNRSFGDKHKHCRFSLNSLKHRNNRSINRILMRN